MCLFSSGEVRGSVRRKNYLVSTRMRACMPATGLQREAENVGAVQPGEEKVLWRPHNNLPVFEVSLQGRQRGALCQEL